jgi:AcrR family transcriptional regulator
MDEVGKDTHSGTARERRLAARRQEILEAARRLAEEAGWAGVTTRALADAIGYSQPVLYGHFPEGKAQIMSAVALDGFVELTRALRTAGTSRGSADAAVAVAEAYLTYAVAHPAVYEAMFTLPIGARFAETDSEPELQEGFAALVAVMGGPSEDVPTATEVFWSALHGMVGLERAGRMRPEDRAERTRVLAARFGSGA